jgi:hypothetical protein
MIDNDKIFVILFLFILIKINSILNLSRVNLDDIFDLNLQTILRVSKMKFKDKI